MIILVMKFLITLILLCVGGVTYSPTVIIQKAPGRLRSRTRWRWNRLRRARAFIAGAAIGAAAATQRSNPVR